MKNEDILFEKEARRYLEEVIQDLDEVEQLILKFDEEQNITDTVSKIKRIIHSLKGTAGSYGFDLISTLCHKMEDRICSLDFFKTVGTEVVDALLKQKDAMVTTCIGYRNNNIVIIDKIKSEFGIFSPGAKIEVSSTSISNVAHVTKATVRESQPMRVLVVEASKMLASKIVEMISEFEIETSRSQDGYEALGRLLKEHFDLMITSLQTPLIDALGLISILDQIPNPNQKIKKIIVTSSKERLKELKTNNVTILEKGASLEQELKQALKEIARPKVNVNLLQINQAIKVLVVDDSPDIHKLVNLSFRSYPTVNTTMCLNPLDAEKMATHIRPDFILLDVQMPQMSGETLFKVLKSNPQLTSVPIIFLTANDTSEELNRLGMLGALKIIKKPFSIKELASEILSDFIKKAA